MDNKNKELMLKTIPIFVIMIFGVFILKILSRFFPEELEILIISWNICAFVIGCFLTYSIVKITKTKTDNELKEKEEKINELKK